jgi:hypothetical protein
MFVITSSDRSISTVNREKIGTKQRVNDAWLLGAGNNDLLIRYQKGKTLHFSSLDVYKTT